MADYKIQPGDTLTKIAKMYGTTVKQLQQMNGIKNPDLIFAGHTLKVPDIDSEDAFNVKGLTVEDKGGRGKGKEIDILKGEVRSLYAYIPPKGDKDPGKWHPPLLLPEDDGDHKIVPMYAYRPPVDDNDKDKPGLRLMYGYPMPADPKDPKPGDCRPEYAIPTPADPKDPKSGEKPIISEKPPVKLVYAVLIPPKGEEPSKPWNPWLPWDPPTKEPENPTKPPYKPGEGPEKPTKPEKPGDPKNPGGGKIRRRGRRIIIELPPETEEPGKPTKPTKPTKPRDGITPDKPGKQTEPVKKPPRKDPPSDFSD